MNTSTKANLPFTGASRTQIPAISNFLVAIWCVCLANACIAADVVATFNTPGGPAADLAGYGIGFELFGNGLYWWQGAGVCGELPNNSELGFKGTTSPYVSASRPVLSCDYQISGGTRDNLNFYFAANKRIYSKWLGASRNDPAQELATIYTPLDNQHDLGAVTLFNGRFYWTDYDNTGSNFTLYSINTDGSDAQLLGLGQGYKVIKMIGYTYHTTSFHYVDAMFLLTADGSLIRWNLNPPAPPIFAAACASRARLPGAPNRCASS